MEFENYERELKYLIKKNEKYTSKQFLEFLYENGYKLVESFEKEKHETYYDDNDFSILKRGDVMRGSNMVTEQFKGFLYKTNKCNPEKPYVSKLELGTKLRGQYKDVNEFIKELNIDVKGQLNIKLFANMKREVSIVEKDGDRLYVSYDKVKYFEKDERLNLAYSTSMTTRKPRAGEVDGKDYFFSTREDFEKAIQEGGLLEWAEFVGNYYGTPLKEVNRLRDEGKNVLLEIEVQGAIQVQEKCPDAVSIFIIPPSMEELERRIRGRSTEPEEIIQQRLAKASNEMKMVSQYKYIVCNDDPKLAAELIKTIILRHVELEENK